MNKNTIFLAGLKSPKTIYCKKCGEALILGDLIVKNYGYEEKSGEKIFFL